MNRRRAMQLTALGALGLARPAAASDRMPAVGKPAPDFRAITYARKPVTLKDYRGQVLVLNFWATWCGPCKRELPLLDAYVRVQEKVGLRALAVATEDSLDESYLRPLAASMLIPLVHSFSGPYRFPDGLPTNYVIDRSGVLRYAEAGAFNLDELNAVLVPLLREAPPQDPAPAPPTPTSTA